MRDYKHEHETYIRSAQWRARRDAYYATHARACAACGTFGKKGNLITLHHLSYKRMGNEPDGDLMPLCEKHHAEVHRVQKRTERSIREATEAVVQRYAKRRNGQKGRRKLPHAHKRFGSMRKPPANLSPYGEDGRGRAA